MEGLNAPNRGNLAGSSPQSATGALPHPVLSYRNRFSNSYSLLFGEGGPGDEYGEEFNDSQDGHSEGVEDEEAERSFSDNGYFPPHSQPMLIPGMSEASEPRGGTMHAVQEREQYARSRGREQSHLAGGTRHGLGSSTSRLSARLHSEVRPGPGALGESIGVGVEFANPEEERAWRDQFQGSPFQLVAPRRWRSMIDVVSAGFSGARGHGWQNSDVSTTEDRGSDQSDCSGGLATPSMPAKLPSSQGPSGSRWENDLGVQASSHRLLVSYKISGTVLSSGFPGYDSLQEQAPPTEEGNDEEVGDKKRNVGVERKVPKDKTLIPIRENLVPLSRLRHRVHSPNKETKSSSGPEQVGIGGSKSPRARKRSRTREKKRERQSAGRLSSSQPLGESIPTFQEIIGRVGSAGGEATGRSQRPFNFGVAYVITLSLVAIAVEIYFLIRTAWIYYLIRIERLENQIEPPQGEIYQDA